MNEYIIVADYDICGKTSTCMVCIGGTEERAKEVLAEILAGNPRYSDLLGKGVNPRLEGVEPADQWWHQGGLD
jgi:hypothetical protein